MKKISLIALAILSLCMMASSCKQVEKKPQVKNVIYLIGDGMGMGAVSSLLLTEEDVTGFEMAPVVGLSETSSAFSCRRYSSGNRNTNKKRLSWC